jgi:hypothetical protein
MHPLAWNRVAFLESAAPRGFEGNNESVILFISMPAWLRFFGFVWLPCVEDRVLENAIGVEWR